MGKKSDWLEMSDPDDPPTQRTEREGPPFPSKTKAPLSIKIIQQKVVKLDAGYFLCLT